MRGHGPDRGEGHHQIRQQDGPKRHQPAAGYSSLSYLLRFPADTLKIDRSFVNALGKGGRNEDIVGAIVSLAKSLSMDVVAEGVETVEQRDILRALGCQYGQGYLFSHPLDHDRARAFVK